MCYHFGARKDEDKLKEIADILPSKKLKGIDDGASVGTAKKRGLDAKYDIEALCCNCVFACLCDSLSGFVVAAI